MKINFTQSQKRAINADDGKFAVKAGAGTGKTSVLVNRYLKIYDTLFKDLSPEDICDSILTVTFTKRAARQMRDRLSGSIPDTALRYAHISTIDSFCSRFLKENAFAAGIDPEFKVLDEVESKLYFRKLGLSVLEDEVIWPIQIEKPRESFLNDVYELINSLKQELVGPEMFMNNLVENEEIHRAIYMLYMRYEEALKKDNYMDFGRILNETYRIIKTNPGIRKNVQDKFRYLLVDEYQDTNPAQVELLGIVSAPQDNYFVVGDEQQSIFRFRGAHPEHIVNLFKSLPEGSKVVLKENFRSGAPVPELVNEVFKEEINGYHSIESTISQESRIKLFLGDKREEEAEYISSQTRKFLDSGYDPGDIVVLFRGVKNCAVYEEKMRKYGIKTVTVGGAGFYEQPEIKDIIAMLTVMDNPFSDRELIRLLQSPYFGIKDSELARILYENDSTSKGSSLFEKMKGSGNSKITAFMEFMDFFKDKKRSLSLVELINLTAEKSGLFYRASSQNGGLDSRPMSNLNKFIRMARSFEGRNIFSTLYDFINYLRQIENAAIVEAEARPLVKNVVNLMTVHQAKGLEFPVVFVANVSSGNFPTSNRVNIYHFLKEQGLIIKDKTKGSRYMEILNTRLYREFYEEEKRLFYVALTRAQKHLFITGNINFRGSISKFMSFFLNKKEKGEFKLKSNLKKIIARDKIVPELNVPELNVGELNEDKKIYQDKQSKAKEFLEISKDLGIPGFIKIRDIPVEFSVTKIETYIRCPRLYKYRYFVKIPPPPAEKSFSAALFGSAVHRMLEEYYKIAKPGQVAMPEKIKTLICSTGISSAEFKKNYLKKSEEVIKSIQSSGMLKPAEEILYTEEPFVLKVGSNRIKGTVDRIDKTEGQIELIDYKTAKSADTGHYRFQISIYLEALKEIFKFDKVAPYIYFVAINKIKKVRPIKFINLRIKSAVNGIQSGRFPAISGQHCKYCPYLEICDKNSP